MKTRDEVASQLDEKIPDSVVSEREGGRGQMLAYLQTHYVIDRLNKVLGHGFWSFSHELIPVFSGQMLDNNNVNVYAASYLARVSLVVRIGQGGNPDQYVQTTYQDVGYGDGTDKKHPGKSHELASKEAVSDGLKRCARNLGMSMGLALYDKSFKNVEAPETTTAAAPRPKAAKPKAQTPELAAVPTATPEAVSDTDAKLIAAKIGVLVSMKKTTKEALRVDMMKRYGCDQPEALTVPQVKDFLSQLDSQLSQ